MFQYCSHRLPPASEVCTNRRCMGVKRFPSQLAALTSSRERSGRDARRPWEETSSAPYCKPGRPEVPPSSGGMWLHKTGSGESDGIARQEIGCGAPFRCPLLLTALHLKGAPLFPSPSATAQGRRSRKTMYPHHSPSHRDLIPVSIPPVSRQVATPAEWMPASSAGMMMGDAAGTTPPFMPSSGLTRRPGGHRRQVRLSAPPRRTRE